MNQNERHQEEARLRKIARDVQDNLKGLERTGKKAGKRDRAIRHRKQTRSQISKKGHEDE